MCTKQTVHRLSLFQYDLRFMFYADLATVMLSFNVLHFFKIAQQRWLCNYGKYNRLPFLSYWKEQEMNLLSRLDTISSGSPKSFFFLLWDNMPLVISQGQRRCWATHFWPVWPRYNWCFSIYDFKLFIFVLLKNDTAFYQKNILLGRVLKWVP